MEKPPPNKKKIPKGIEPDCHYYEIEWQGQMYGSKEWETGEITAHESDLPENLPFKAKWSDEEISHQVNVIQQWLLFRVSELELLENIRIVRVDEFIGENSRKALFGWDDFLDE